MRKRFQIQLKLWQTPIEKVEIPTNSRDELPPVLAALQWIFITPEVNEQIFELLEEKVCANKKQTGRPGMDLWHILVLGVVRLTLKCNYDRLEYLAYNDILTRQIMGLDLISTGDFGKGFNHKTICDNIHFFDKELLYKINEITVKAGHALLFNKEEREKIKAKADTYVIKTNVHFPTDLNLLWDACRKCIELINIIFKTLGLDGWRKAKDWRKQLKGLMRTCSKIHKGGGANKEERLKEAANNYLDKAYQLENKIYQSIKELEKRSLDKIEGLKLIELEYFHTKLIKHIDLVERRILKGEIIPHEEKDFSLFEPDTEWINKGKFYPSIELGHKMLITTDQYELIIDYKVMNQSSDVNETLDLADRLLNRFGEGSIESISFDKGFSSEEYRQLLELFFNRVIMPKRGRLDKAAQERESSKKFKELKNKHNAIESDINCLEHHGLNRCPDKGTDSFERYAGFGVLACNLHKIGNKLLEKKRQLKKAA